MRRTLLQLICIALAGMAGPAALAAQAPPLVFVNVNVVPMDSDRVLTGQLVVIDAGRIFRLGPTETTAIPANSLRIDATGQYLIPGLAELHAHLPADPGPDMDRVLTLFMVNGVTTIRSMLGAPAHLELRSAIASGERLAPRIVASGPSFNGSSVTGPEQAGERLRKQHAAGYDFAKLHPGLKTDEFAAITVAAAELGMPVGGHVSLDVGLDRALRAQQATIDHLDGYMQALLPADFDPSAEQQSFFAIGLAGKVDSKKIPDLARRTAAAGVWNVPTQTLFENLLSNESPTSLAARPEMRYMPDTTVASWVSAKQRLSADSNFDADVGLKALKIRRQLIKALHDEKAGLLLGSDAPQIFNVPGFAAHRELGVMVDSGLSPFAALESATANPARFLGEEDEFGTLAIGNRADLILLSANPLLDIANTRQILGVVRDGHWLDRAALDDMLKAYE